MRSRMCAKEKEKLYHNPQNILFFPEIPVFKFESEMKPKRRDKKNSFYIQT